MEECHEALGVALHSKLPVQDPVLPVSGVSEEVTITQENKVKCAMASTRRRLDTDCKLKILGDLRRDRTKYR